ncbi:MAG: cytidylate kinase-like family protein [Chloroflexi bacterium]|nr:cytidylate kinase-like family protein [Chloroflexota bacterium]
MPRTVITVGRQMASGGDLIAAELAKALGVQLLEHQIIEAAAAAAGVSPETIIQAEKVPSFLERMLEYLGQHTGGLDPLSNFSMERPAGQTMTLESYRHLIEDVVRKTAEESDAVIVAHGGAVVLRDMPYVFKIMVCAPVRVRAQRLQEFEHIAADEAERRIREDDKTRIDFFQTYYKVNWLNPAVYDLCINTARLDTEAAVDLIVKAHGKAITE